MIKWLVDNIKGKHIKKKASIKDLDEYFEFMFDDFNNRLRLSLLIGIVFGFILGLGTVMMF